MPRSSAWQLAAIQGAKQVALAPVDEIINVYKQINGSHIDFFTSQMSDSGCCLWVERLVYIATTF